jgi:hypothetical protein
VDKTGIKCDIFVIIGLSAAGYGLFLCHGLGVCLEVVGSFMIMCGVTGHYNNAKPKGPVK